MRRAPRLVLAVVALLLGLLLVPPAEASTGTLYGHVDRSRTAAGLKVLVRDAALQRVAQAWAEQLARAGRLSHNPSYAQQIPGGWSRAGENVAYVGSGHSAPDDVLHSMWMTSAGHKANILGDYTTIGIGRKVDSSGRVWAVQVFATYTRSPSPLSVFTDVQVGEPYSESIAWLKERGITQGYGDGSFGRKDPVTRGQMAAFLYRAAGSPAFTPPTTATFSDVRRGSAFHKEVEWLVSRGIASRASVYRPTASVSRGEMAAFLARAKGPRPLSVPSRATFADVRPGTYVFAPVEWMAREGVAASSGTAPRYNPGWSVTREHMAAFVFRAYS
ncbi:S-layer homology domain-containing protein [Aquipuribacter sp. SD81]|uniref:CAP and S-layer homology domain-containing protein n=1 Tax=Aquipuribacter sp. SD81 TaxID=3127703 RepID=UPI0030165E04